MARLHAATVSPSKLELVAACLAQHGDAVDVDALELVGAYRFDDPDGAVGLETHLVRCQGVLVQVPTTYRDAPLDGAEEALAGTMEHSALGRRWVYDGLADPAYVGMLAAVTLTGAGQSVGVLHREGRALVRPPSVRLSWTGPEIRSAPVDGFGAAECHDTTSVLSNDDVTLFFEHEPTTATGGDDDDFRLTGTWAGLEAPVLLAGAVLRGGGPAAS